MEKQYHLDSQYRKRWQEFHLASGTVEDSRQIYWRHVDWSQVVQVITHIDGKTYATHCKQPDFKFFVVYRWGGHEWIKGKKKPIREWAVGWSNGEKCFMTDIDFKTGQINRQYVVPVEAVKGHIHPKVRGRIC
jgi:hypothetical protein